MQFKVLVRLTANRRISNAIKHTLEIHKHSYGPTIYTLYEELVNGKL